MTGHGRQLRRDVLLAERQRKQQIARQRLALRLALRIRLLTLGRRWPR